ncbi:MAG TPA: hypothetical protein VFH95_10155 [Candidatus Kapabacteria bacterium]|nr:hypothetical protein [Candidatus Kapabacteria bacterium]
MPYLPLHVSVSFQVPIWWRSEYEMNTLVGKKAQISRVSLTETNIRLIEQQKFHYEL